MGKRYDADVNAGQLLVLWKVANPSISTVYTGMVMTSADPTLPRLPAKIYREFQTVVVWFKR